MGIPVVIVESGGLAVTVSDNGYGVAMTEADNGIGLAVTIVDSGGMPVVGISGDDPSITISSTTIAENAADNSVVGALSVNNPEGTYVFTIELGDDPDNKFAISGSNLIIDELLDYETATSHQVTVTANPDVGATITRTFTIIVTDVDDTAPTITSANSADNTENTVLAHALTANEAVTWTITGGADQALFEISGSTLRWASNGTKDYEAPDDADTNNTYVVQVTATDAATNATNQTITVTVTNVGEGGGSAGEPIGLLLTLTKAA